MTAEKKKTHLLKLNKLPPSITNIICSNLLLLLQRWELDWSPFLLRFFALWLIFRRTSKVAISKIGLLSSSGFWFIISFGSFNTSTVFANGERNTSWFTAYTLTFTDFRCCKSWTICNCFFYHVIQFWSLDSNGSHSLFYIIFTLCWYKLLSFVCLFLDERLDAALSSVRLLKIHFKSVPSLLNVKM